jgi:hypothetical protein
MDISTIDSRYQVRRTGGGADDYPNAVAADQELPGRRVTEREAWSASGVRCLVLSIATLIAGAVLLTVGIKLSTGPGQVALILFAVLVLAAGDLALHGLTSVVAGEARAVQLFDDFTEFVTIQTETAVRHIASSYPYDNRGSGALSLRDNAEEITRQLSEEIAERVASAGVQVIKSRLTRLSYAPEIAQAMLRQQQANAVVGARQRIVEGAVGMVQLALQRLQEEGVVELDEERKAMMVSNLLVVLCSEQATQPVVNTGSLYQ